MNIYQKIVKIMSEVDYIQKDEKRVNNTYRFVSHDSVTAKIHPYLVKYNVAVIPSVQKMTQNGNRTEVLLNVKFVNAENPTDFISIDYEGYGIDNGDKGPGKAVSYAFKYALLKMFCLETGEDPDYDQNVKFEGGEEAIDYDRFKKELLENIVNPQDYSHLQFLQDYLTGLSQSTNYSQKQLMQKALIPMNSLRFLDAFKKWYEEMNV